MSAFLRIKDGETMSATTIIDMAPLGALIRYSDGSAKPPARFTKKLAAWERSTGLGRLVKKEAPRRYATWTAPASFTLHEGDFSSDGVILVTIMAAAVAHVDDLLPDTSPQMLAILDRDERLVLAGSASPCAVASCHPVRSAVEARSVVMEASQLRAEARRALDWHEPDLAERLRHRAELLEARLVDPLRRGFFARALDLAA